MLNNAENIVLKNTMWVVLNATLLPSDSVITHELAGKIKLNNQVTMLLHTVGLNTDTNVCLLKMSQFIGAANMFIANFGCIPSKILCRLVR